MPYCIDCGKGIADGLKCRTCSGDFVPLKKPESPATATALKVFGVATMLLGVFVAIPIIDNPVLGVTYGIGAAVAGLLGGFQLFALGLIVEYLNSLKSYAEQRGA